jgi:hypothetical protein
MTDFYDIVFGPGSKALRRDAKVRLTVDADGKGAVEPITGDTIILSPVGSIDRITVERDRVYHCGCTAEVPMGGKCGEPGCGRVSCQKCFTRCRLCGKPLCLEHLRKLQAGPDVPAEGAEVHLCIRCHGEVTRRKAVHGVVKALLRPFVEWGEEPKR